MEIAEFNEVCRPLLQSIAQALGHDAPLHITFVHNDPNPENNPQLRFEIGGYHFDVKQGLIDMLGGHKAILYALRHIRGQITQVKEVGNGTETS